MRPALLATVGAALAVALGGCAGSLRAWIGPAAAPPSTVNRPLAQRDATRMLAALRLPRGAVLLRRKPPGVNRDMLETGPFLGDAANAYRSAWWLLPPKTSMASAIAYVKAHPPHGARVTGSGSGYDSSGLTLLSVLFSWPPVPGRLEDRDLRVTAIRVRGGRVAALAEAQSDWVVLRSGEQVPAGVRTVAVTYQRPPTRPADRRPGPTSRVLITRPASVRRAVDLVNSLGVTQPVAGSCPALALPSGKLTVDYLAKRNSSPLASAQLTLWANTATIGTGNRCDPIELQIHGRAQHPLRGASFARQILTLAGLAAH